MRGVSIVAARAGCYDGCTIRPIQRKENAMAATSSPACARLARRAFRPARRRRQRHTLARRAWPERPARHVHLQPLPVRSRGGAKIERDTDALARLGIGSIAIMSNDAAAYPEDSFDNMKTFAASTASGFRT
jgi:hypothetical protein